MKAILISPEKTLFEGKVHLVQVPGTKGSFAVLKNHAPIISTLEKGIVRIITIEGKELKFEINNGFIEVKDNNINILVM